MKLAGEQLDSGHAAVFLLAEDAVASKVEGKVRALSSLRHYNGISSDGGTRLGATSPLPAGYLTDEYGTWGSQ